MSERLIYRPNCFSPEQWEALSREEQVAWWQEEIKKPRAAKITHILTVLQGMDYSAAESAHFIIYHLTEDNIVDEFSLIPDEIVKCIRKTVQDCPSDSDDKAWEQTIFISSAHAHFSDEPDQIANIRQHDKDTFRGAVRAFREMDKPRSGGIQ